MLIELQHYPWANAMCTSLFGYGALEDHFICRELLDISRILCVLSLSVNCDHDVGLF